MIKLKLLNNVTCIYVSLYYFIACLNLHKFVQLARWVASKCSNRKKCIVVVCVCLYITLFCRQKKSRICMYPMCILYALRWIFVVQGKGREWKKKQQVPVSIKWPNQKEMRRRASSHSFDGKQRELLMSNNIQIIAVISIVRNELRLCRAYRRDKSQIGLSNTTVIVHNDHIFEWILLMISPRPIYIIN